MQRHMPPFPFLGCSVEFADAGWLYRHFDVFGLVAKLLVCLHRGLWGGWMLINMPLKLGFEHLHWFPLSWRLQKLRYRKGGRALGR